MAEREGTAPRVRVIWQVWLPIPCRVLLVRSKLQARSYRAVARGTQRGGW